VVSGINPGDPQSVRGARMQIYQQFISALDGSGEKISSQLSEIDLSDPADVKATVPSAGTDLVLQFGQEDFLARWRNYQAHVAQWRQQYPNLVGVDLRYEHQVVLKLGPKAEAPSDAAANPATNPALAPAAKRPAVAAHPAKAKRTAAKARPATRTHGQASRHAGRGAR
jgi:cell division protein FtsQ